MIKTCVTLTLAVLMVLSFKVSDVSAETVKKTNNAKSAKFSKKAKKKNKKFRARKTKTKRVGNGPDLRALTTELPNSEYTEMPDNGVNAVEMKTGL